MIRNYNVFEIVQFSGLLRRFTPRKDGFLCCLCERSEAIQNLRIGVFL